MFGAITRMLFPASSPLLHAKRVTRMTGPHGVDPYRLLTQAGGDASPHLLRTMVRRESTCCCLLTPTPSWAPNTVSQHLHQTQLSLSIVSDSAANRNGAGVLPLRISYFYTRKTLGTKPRAIKQTWRLQKFFTYISTHF